MREITVSIHCITYNHEKYIRRAMDGFLMQQTDFDIEIVVGEDCSPDRTREILLEYKASHPDKIKLILHEKNVGMQQNGMLTGAACTGKYIAICEGDDYWTDPLKLQKQVDFLEANPDFAFCFHNVLIAPDGDESKGWASNRNQPEISTFEDLAARNFVQTVSCCFRRDLVPELPEWFGRVTVGDWVMHLLNAQHGKIRYIDETMAVYRVHAGGTWSLKTNAERSRRWLEVVELCYRHFYPRGSEQFARQISRAKIDLCFHLFEEGNYAEFRRTYLDYAKNVRPLLPRPFAALSLRMLLSYAPALAAAYEQQQQRRANT